MAQQLLERSLATSTRQQYQKAFDKCLLFIRDHLQQSSTLPLSQEQLHLYIAYMHSLNYKHATIAPHLSAISHFHKLQNLPDPAATYSTSKMLTGVKNSQQHPPDARRPITRDILCGLLISLQSCTDTNYENYFISRSLQSCIMLVYAPVRLYRLERHSI